MINQVIFNMEHNFKIDSFKIDIFLVDFVYLSVKNICVNIVRICCGDSATIWPQTTR